VLFFVLFKTINLRTLMFYINFNLAVLFVLVVSHVSVLFVCGVSPDTLFDWRVLSIQWHTQEILCFCWIDTVGLLTEIFGASGVRPQRLLYFTGVSSIPARFSTSEIFGCVCSTA